MAVIGAGGRMGSWFANYFARLNYAVYAFDVDRESLKLQPGITVADSLSSCVGQVDAVLVCVPVASTPTILKQCSRHMRKGSVLGEISSVKTNTFTAISKIRRDLVPLCLHPMFGPGATDKRQQRILLVPVRDGEEELKAAEGLFKDSTIIPMPDAKSHDDAIGVVLGLTYFTNLAFAQLLSQKDLDLLEKVSGTSFRLQSILAESVLTDDPGLVAALIKDNPYAHVHMREYLKQARAIATTAASDRRKLLSYLARLQKQMQSKRDLHKSYKRLYSAIGAMDE
ncbi:MAG TPA: prephenate dehydrogenase/arogenate dehydrogenase family protein [Nitrososphaera sp.]|nr:prephenate dehydrogenase/arogenate dehydrogenase family protein [Nitrososphaera sp.]